MLGVFFRELRAIGIFKFLWNIGSCHEQIGIIWLHFHFASFICLLILFQLRHQTLHWEKVEYPCLILKFRINASNYPNYNKKLLKNCHKQCLLHQSIIFLFLVCSRSLTIKVAWLCQRLSIQINLSPCMCYITFT